MANRTAANFKSTQDIIFADNTTRDISEADSRNAYTDISESVQFIKNSVTSLGADPSAWNVNSFDVRKDSCSATTNLAITMSNTVDLGLYTLQVLKTTASAVTVTVTHSGLTAKYPNNGSNVSLSGGSNTYYLLKVERVGSLLFIHDVITDSTGTAILTTTTTLTQSQIQSLNTTPIELIAAPGSGSIIEVVSAYACYSHNGTDYSGGSILSLRFAGVSSNHFSTESAFISANGDKLQKFVINNRGNLNNNALNAFADADSTGAGGTIKIDVLYRILSIT